MLIPTSLPLLQSVTQQLGAVAPASAHSPGEGALGLST